MTTKKLAKGRYEVRPGLTVEARGDQWLVMAGEKCVHRCFSKQHAVDVATKRVVVCADCGRLSYAWDYNLCQRCADKHDDEARSYAAGAEAARKVDRAYAMADEIMASRDREAALRLAFRLCNVKA